MTTLKIEGLRAEVAGREILRGIDLQVRSGEVHAVMGPNGAGKSTLSAVLLGRPGYTVTAGSVTLVPDDGAPIDLLALPTWQRAVAGVHLILQYPTEVPGVALVDALSAALVARGRDAAGLPAELRAEAARIGFDPEFLSRPLNVDLSGGEKKRNETIQLAVLRPKIAILDELDSGLDIDSLRSSAKRVADAVREDNLGVVAITHYPRLLAQLHPDRVHILIKGRIVASGGAELADQLERDGYAAFQTDGDADEPTTPAVVARPASLDDLFANP